MTLQLCHLIQYQKWTICMKKPCRKYAPKANTRPFLILVNTPKQIISFDKQAITCQEFFYKLDILKEDYQKGLKKLTLFFFRTAYYLYVTRMYLNVIRMSLLCTHISSLCHSYVLVCHPYVTRMYSHVIRISLVCGFTMNHIKKPQVHFIIINIFDRKCTTPYGCITFIFYQKYFYEKTDLRHFYFRATIETVISYPFDANFLS